MRDPCNVKLTHCGERLPIKAGLTEAARGSSSGAQEQAYRSFYTESVNRELKDVRQNASFTVKRGTGPVPGTGPACPSVPVAGPVPGL